MGLREIARSTDVTENSTGKVGKVGKVGPKPWEIESYIYKEEPEDAKRSSHGDPRLESALQSLSLHQDDFIPSDDDHGSGHPACGLGATPDLHASASSASDLGTLAGGSWGFRDKNGKYKRRETSRDTDQRVVNWLNKADARYASNSTPYHSARTSDFGSSGYHTCEDTQ